MAFGHLTGNERKIEDLFRA